MANLSQTETNGSAALLVEWPAEERDSSALADGVQIILDEDETETDENDPVMVFDENDDGGDDGDDDDSDDEEDEDDETDE